MVDKDEIIKTIRAYIDCLPRDPAAAARYCNEPFMVIGAAEALVFDSRADIEAFYTKLVSNLKARGYSHSSWLELHVRPLSPATALVSGMGVRYTTTGVELERIGGTYLFRKADDGWKIAALTIHDPAAVVRLE
jgi:ketosteroid isomerase-like protein